MATATDIITYVGIPLAVFGVLPTIYTCLKSLLTLRSIRKILDQNGVTAITRSTLLSGIIEIEIPRKSIIPLDRNDPAYFALSPAPSSLRGGSWTLFNWKEMVIGVKSYRVQYHDELLQPQAEVDFEQLLAFLLDRGAVPDATGFSDLRSSGLWTPAGTKLLSSPISSEPVLMVAAASDSDGILSLSLDWKSEWDKRDSESLPPYWIRISPIPEQEVIRKALLGQKPDDNLEDSNEKQSRETSADSHLNLEKDTSRRLSVLSTLSPLPTNLHTSPIRLRITDSGLQTAHSDLLLHRPLPTPHLTPSAPSSSTPSTYPPSTWFSTIATALAAPLGTLWSHTPPTPLLTLPHRDSIPCGILSLLSILPDSALPTWRTPHDEEKENLDRQMAMHARARATLAEHRLPPADRERARAERFRRETWELHDAARRAALERRQREEQVVTEALRSQKLPLGVVAAGCRKFLASEEGGRVVGPEMSAREVVEQVLHLMVLDERVVDGVVGMLELWRKWTENGGMGRQHLEEVRGRVVEFGIASCVLEVVREAGSHPVGAVVGDLKECLRVWKRVRLG